MSLDCNCRINMCQVAIGYDSSIVDGNDILPAGTGLTGTPPNDIVLWWHNGKWVARDNEWKLVDTGGGPELYHIIDDISETADVYVDNPAVVDRLYSHYTNVVAEFDLLTDTSRWNTNDAAYYMNITDPAYHVIYEPTNVAEWVEAQYPGTDMDNDGIGDILLHNRPFGKVTRWLMNVDGIKDKLKIRTGVDANWVTVGVGH